jgi:SAM-dependent methyltransferase
MFANNKETEQQIVEYYNNELTMYGTDIKVFWNSTESQLSRFEVLSQIGDLNQHSLLDAGCGFADYYFYLEQQGIKLTGYTGIDINPKFIEIARSRLAGKNIELIAQSVLAFNTEDSWDYVVGSGLFAIDMPDWEEVFKKQLRHFINWRELAQVLIS